MLCTVFSPATTGGRVDRELIIIIMYSLVLIVIGSYGNGIIIIIKSLPKCAFTTLREVSPGMICGLGPATLLQF